MRKILLMIIVASLAVFLFGCGSSSEKSSASKNGSSEKRTEETSGKKDFVAYLNDVKPLVLEVESVYAKDYDAIRQQSANGEISDLEFGKKIADEVLPKGIKLSDKISDIMPPKELREVHEKFIDMVSKSNQAMTELVAAVDSGDVSKITSANNLLSESTKLERDFVYELQDLAKKYNIEFKQQD